MECERKEIFTDIENFLQKRRFSSAITVSVRVKSAENG